MSVRREGTCISIVEDGRILWSGRTDGSITYPQDGQNWTRMVNRCTDQELIDAVKKIEQHKRQHLTSQVALLSEELSNEL